MYVHTDTAKSYNEIVVSPSVQNWTRVFALYLTGPFFAGDILDIDAEIQFANANNFAIECRDGIFVYVDNASPPAVQYDTAGIIHPITGENAGPYNEVDDKYVVLDKSFKYVIPYDCSTLWIDYRVCARSSQAVSTTRMGLSNGFLQVTELT